MYIETKAEGRFYEETYLSLNTYTDLERILHHESKKKQTFGLTKMQLLNIILLLSVFVLSSALAKGTVPVDFCYSINSFSARIELKDPEKVVSRDGPSRGVSYINFVEEKHSYLNITALGGDFVDNMPECSFACLDIPSCFSFNFGATPEANDRFRCELLPSDKYNNSNKFVHSLSFHHFSIATPCRSWPCQNNGKCLPVYEENDYKCLCQGFWGKNCEKGKKYSKNTVPHLS
ncbi:uncharacterized protein LOC114972317 [Acropora millepora]|uniref:uncharacterized protein LOC114972317 n=1 Tax=Acropora millepora TaxID=45264 RepID=UPI001CF4FA31|nr:uncharacterized protein LOC114972317 [Acropora millepora]